MNTYLSILNSMSLTLYTLIKDEQNIRLKQGEKEKPLSGSEAYLINTKALVTLFMLITVLNRNLLSLSLVVFD